MRVLISPHPRWHLLLFVFFITAILTSTKCIMFVSIWFSLMTNDVEHLFMGLLTMYIPSLKKMYIQILCLFSIWLAFYCWIVRVLCIFWSPLSDISFANIFSHFVSFFSLSWFSSVQFSRSVVSDSLWPHELQHTRPPCPSPTPRVHSNSCSSSWWCHPAILSSVVPFSSCPHSLQASGTFPMSQLFASGGQNIGVSALASVPPMNTQDWSPLGWTDWIPLQSKGLSRVFSNTTVQKHQFFGAQLSSQSNSHIHTWPLEKP